MKKILYILATLLVALTSCNKGGGITLPNATGSAGEILLVIDDSIAKSAAGDSIYRLLDRDVPCLPQSEPHFNISKTKHSGFTSILKPARNIVIVNVGNRYSHNKIKTYTDRYSKPQAIIEINGPTKEGVRKAIADHGDEILDFFVKAERDRAIKYQSHYRERAVGQKVKEKFGCDIVIPKGLTRIKEAENFMWIANSNIDIQQNVVIYSYPYTDKNTFTKEYLTAKRDSIMKLHVEGPAENSYMGTEYRYDPPIMKETALKSGQYATEVRGLWTIIGDIMGGPFVSVSCLDEENQRVITAECFVYAPGKNKRNILRNLESVLYTIKFEKDEQH